MLPVLEHPELAENDHRKDIDSPQLMPDRKRLQIWRIGRIDESPNGMPVAQPGAADPIRSHGIDQTSGTTAICSLNAGRDVIAAYQRSKLGIAGRSVTSCIKR